MNNNITMGDTSDYVYQNFYNTMQSSNSAHYINAITAMSIGNIELANTELSLIVDSTRIDKNRITVGTIYLNTWAQGNYTLTDDQISILYDIANYDPATNGDAVYTARVMLNINPDNRDLKFTLAPNVHQKQLKENTVKVYPNPAKKQFTIEFKDNNSNNAIIDIYNSIGNLVLTDNIQQGIYIKNINVGMLNDGLYFYRIIIDGTNVASGKLIIFNK